MESQAVTSSTELPFDLKPVDFQTTIGQANFIAATLGTQEDFSCKIEQQNCEQLNNIDLGLQWPLYSGEEKEINLIWHTGGFTGVSEASTEMSSFSTSTNQNPTVCSSLHEGSRSLVATDRSCTNNTESPARRTKVVFSRRQLEALESRFTKQKYLNQRETKNMAADLGLTLKQVKTWFQNRRMRFKKQKRQIEWEAQRFAHRPSYTPPTSLQGQFDGSYNFNFTGNPEQYLSHQTVASTPTDAERGIYQLFPLKCSDQHCFSCQSY